MTDEEQQEFMHTAIATAMNEVGIMADDEILTGWVLAYERRSSDSTAAGAMHGPETITPWNAIGLLEWARICVNDNINEDDD